jgi:solute:Na+ symporter, SSS family
LYEFGVFRKDKSHMDVSALDFSTNFGVLDWAIISVYLLFVVSVGVYIRKYISNATDFMVAGRGLKTFLAVATMIGTEMGLITVMYAAQKGFTGGFAAFHIALAAAIATLFVGLTGFVVVPLRRHNVMTIPEFYQKRFTRGVRITGGTILAFSGILNMGMFLKAGSLFLTGITGLDSAESGVALKIIMSVLLAMVLLYTTLGGMVSVVILDYIQFTVLSVTLIITTVLSIRLLGWDNIVNTVMEVRGEAGFNPLLETEAGFGVSYIVWMFMLGLVSCAFWQTAVIRACSADSVKTVRRLYIFSSVGFLIRFLIPYFLGISALVYFFNVPGFKEFFVPESGLPDPEISLRAMPLYLGKILPTGFVGVITAGMLAAFMSTHDSYLLCWSSVLTQDVVAPCFKGGLSSKTRLLLTRIFILCIGLFVLIWGLWYPLGQDLWDYIAISGAIYFTGAIPILTLGLYWKRASTAGAYMSLFCGFLAVLGLKPVQDILGGLLGRELILPSEKVGLSVIVLSTVLMVAGSLIFPDKKGAENA